MTEESDVIVRTEGAVRYVSIHRPHVKNALTIGVIRSLTEGIQSATTDKTVRVVVLRGEGGSFCSGLDLKAFAGQGALQNLLDEGLNHFQNLVRAVDQCPRPVIASVDGPAAGFGCDLALSCDLRVASTRAYFLESFVKIGLVPDGGGTYWLPRLVGAAKAAELIMLGERLPADEALRLGVVNRVCPPETLDETVRDWAQRLADGPPKALRLVKEALRKNAHATLNQSLEVEKKAQIQCLQSPDMMEGIMSFLEKRAPRFSDDT